MPILSLAQMAPADAVDAVTLCAVTVEAAMFVADNVETDMREAARPAAETVEAFIAEAVTVEAVRLYLTLKFPKLPRA